DPPRDLRPVRRLSRAPAPRAGRRGGALHVAAAAGPARLGARPAADRAPLGSGGGAAVAGGGPNGPAGGGTRPGGPAHLRALVHAPRVAIAPPPSRRGPGPLRAPATAGPGVHHRGRRRASGLRPNQDAPAACTHLPRIHAR